MTGQQSKVLKFIRDFIDQHKYSPSIREIAAAMGTKSTSRIHEVLAALKRDGKITWLPHCQRTIEIMPEIAPVACTTCNDIMMVGDWMTVNDRKVCVAARICGHCHGGADTVYSRAAIGELPDKRILPTITPPPQQRSNEICQTDHTKKTPCSASPAPSTSMSAPA